MNNVFVDFMNLVISRVQAAVPALQFVGQDFGQLEKIGSATPAAIAFPCALIDLREIVWEDLPGNAQQGTGNLQIRIAVDAAGNNVNTYYALEQAIHKALQGQVLGNGYGKLLRRSSDSEQLSDKLHLRVVKYAVSLRDNSTVDNSTKTPRPNPVINKYS
ncbi:hypothetical protein [Chitinophaga flava]|uniref:DUF3168 domain-containing protein n=1 Tax=Chitinophaga flava TaxID=2259036 RepID=A0A365XR84_9BACT|nr:hypothetical protein [Chitinophaga flava]RBL88541.1 hypothetical protein DF182_18350 [Chitinophaga flava]